MDLEKLRKFISAEIMRITLEWNTKEEIYPVKPPNLSEAQTTVWDMMTKDKTIGSLSEMESRALRDMAVEVLGTKIPEKTTKTVKSIPPYAMLTALTSDFECARQGEQVIMKMSGMWASTRGNTSKVMPFSSAWGRIPTVEEVEDLVSRTPDDKLCIAFAGLLPVKISKEFMERIEAMVLANTETTFANRPVLDGIAPEEIEAYKAADSVGIETSKMIFALTKTKWSDEIHKKVKATLNETPKIEKLSAYILDGKVYVNVGTANILKDTISAVPIKNWDSITQPDAKTINKALKAIKHNFLFPYLPMDMQEELLKEVQFE